MSIPYFFTPVTVTNTRGQTCYSVDGGLLSNFSIGLFDTPPRGAPEWPTFGFALVLEPADLTADVRVESSIGGPLTRFAVLFQTAVVAHDAHALAVPDVAARAPQIDDLGIPPTYFDLTQSRRQHSTSRAKPRPGTFWRPGISSRTRRDSAAGPLRSGANRGWRSPQQTRLRSEAEFVVVDHGDQRRVQVYALGARDP